jgi:hypothetical protein
MAAGFQRDIGGCATRFLARHAQGVDFSMRFTGALMPALTDHLTIAHNHAAHIGVRHRRKAAASRQFQRTRHVKFIHGLIL